MGTENSVKAWGGMEVERRESMGEKKEVIWNTFNDKDKTNQQKY